MKRLALVAVALVAVAAASALAANSLHSDDAFDGVALHSLNDNNKKNGKNDADASPPHFAVDGLAGSSNSGSSGSGGFTPAPPPVPSRTWNFGGTTLYAARTSNYSTQLFIQCTGCFGTQAPTIITAIVSPLTKRLISSTTQYEQCTCNTNDGIAICGNQTLVDMQSLSDVTPGWLESGPNYVTMCSGDIVLLQQLQQWSNSSWALLWYERDVQEFNWWNITWTLQNFGVYEVIALAGTWQEPIIVGLNDYSYLWAGYVEILNIAAGTWIDVIPECPSIYTGDYSGFWAGVSFDESVLIVSCPGSVAAYNAFTLSPLWNVSDNVLGCVDWTADYAQVPVVHGRYYFGACSSPYGIDIRSGDVLFPQNGGGGGLYGDFASPAFPVARGYVAVDSRSGLYLLNPNTGATVAHEKLAAPQKVAQTLSPIALDKYVVVPRNGELTAYQFELPPPPPPPPHRRSITRSLYLSSSCFGSPIVQNSYTEGCVFNANSNTSWLLTCEPQRTLSIATFFGWGCSSASYLNYTQYALDSCARAGVGIGLEWTGCRRA